MDKVISFIQPSRNNLKYLKWSYNSIRKNLGYRHEICWADDFSDDGTWEWMNEIIKKDPNVKIHRNEGPTRLGHTILYDTLVDMATNDNIMIDSNEELHISEREFIKIPYDKEILNNSSFDDMYKKIDEYIINQNK